MPNELQTVTKPSITMEQCKEYMPERYLHASNLCTGPLTGGVSACGGDSGGPLEQKRQLIGVVSWGVMPCGSRNAPSVYVRVSAFIDWIREIAIGSPESNRVMLNARQLQLDRLP